MSEFTASAFSRDKLTDLLALVTDNAQARWPDVTYLLNSDVAWRLPGSAPKDNIRLWYDETGIAAYAWFAPGSPIAFDVRTDLDMSSSVYTDVIHWLENRCSEFPASYPWLLELKSMADWEQALEDSLMAKPYDKKVLMLSALDQHEERRQFLTEQGFQPTEHFQFSLTRSLAEPVDLPPIAEGYHVHSVAEADFEQRVITHRDAWFKSGFTLEQYLRVRSIDIFEPELDLVAEAPNGEFGAYCIGWLDKELGVGSFEPVGTRPAHRRLGLGQAVNLEGLKRMRDMGMHTAKIGTAGFNDRAFGLYVSCGFKLADKDRTWIKVLPS